MPPYLVVCCHVCSFHCYWTNGFPLSKNDGAQWQHYDGSNLLVRLCNVYAAWGFQIRVRIYERSFDLLFIRMSWPAHKYNMYSQRNSRQFH